MDDADDSLPVWLRPDSVGGTRESVGSAAAREESLEVAASQLSAPSRCFLVEVARRCHERHRGIRLLRLPWFDGDLVILIDAAVAVQLDEQIEVIVVFDGNGISVEFGDWESTDARFADASRYLDQLLDHAGS